MKSELTSRVKIKIDQIMRAQGLKRYSLAEKAGISSPTIQNWYTTRNYQPTIYSLERIAGVLNVSVAYLFLDDNETMCPVDKELKNFISIFYKLDKKGREIVFQVMEKMQKE